MFSTDTAIILKKTPHKEKDERIDLLTYSQGKITVFSPGSRDPKSKKAGLLEPANIVKIQLRQSKQQYFTLTEVQLIKSLGFECIEQDKSLGQFNTMQTLLALVLKSLPDAEPHPDVFDLLSQALQSLYSPSITAVFMIHLYDLLGYLPNWKQSVLSHEAININVDLVFVPELRGFAQLSEVSKLSGLNWKKVEKTVVKSCYFWQKSSFYNSLQLETDKQWYSQVLGILKCIDITSH